jgi:hypothetical protein
MNDLKSSRGSLQELSIEYIIRSFEVVINMSLMAEEKHTYYNELFQE